MTIPGGRHARPFEIKEDGFRHLDRVVDECGRHGIYTVIDLHALPGSQNQHWHSDNPTHLPSFWQHPHFQDRVVHLWEFIAGRYKDDPWVAGYNPINEPADESRALVGPYYRRLVTAIRAADPATMLFLDGNTYSTEFDIFDEPWENTLYVCHDYARAGLARVGDYPGETDGVYSDRGTLERKFLERTSTRGAPAPRSGSASSGRSTPATSGWTLSGGCCSTTSSTSTARTTPAGRSGRARISACRGSPMSGRTRRT